jgi:hypothetical protein
MNENYLRDMERSLQTETGAPLFTPQINNYETNNNQEVDIFKKLYDQRKFKDMKSQDNYNKYVDEINKLAEIKLTSDKTDHLYEKMKKECYFKLFEKLDYDQDSIIKYDENLEKIVKENYNEAVSRYLAPIIEELKNQDETLTFDEFTIAMDQIFSILNVEERRTFISNLRERKKVPSQNDNKFTFSPQINNKTQKVFSHSKKYSKDLYERNQDFIKNKTQYVTSKKEEKINAEIASKILFNPRLYIQTKN